MDQVVPLDLPPAWDVLLELTKLVSLEKPPSFMLATVYLWRPCTPLKGLLEVT